MYKGTNASSETLPRYPLLYPSLAHQVPVEIPLRMLSSVNVVLFMTILPP